MSQQAVVSTAFSTYKNYNKLNGVIVKNLLEIP